ncbi:hypothetical protein ACE1TF_19860 [Geomicrobium sp. JSM 1781026]|uniref:hypothetical protein n=1 Tax=Geomicrobium sp. JSM 1781026 TaxID=3344580 RepID=UPI0035C0E9BA
MIHSVKFLHGLFNTKAHFSTLKESEATKGLAWRLTVGALIIGLITVLSQFAVRDDMMQVYQSMPGMGEEEASIFVSIMMALGGVFAVGASIVAILAIALVFWIFFREVGFKRLFIIFSYFIPIYIIVMLVDLPYYFLFGMEHLYSVTGLGYVAALLFEDSFFTHFFAQISLLVVWCFIVQLFALRVVSTKSTRYIVITSTVFYLLLMVILAAVMYMSMLQAQGVQ